MIILVSISDHIWQKCGLCYHVLQLSNINLLCNNLETSQLATENTKCNFYVPQTEQSGAYCVLGLSLSLSMSVYSQTLTFHVTSNLFNITVLMYGKHTSVSSTF